jgi:hypothetical protein
MALVFSVIRRLSVIIQANSLVFDRETLSYRDDDLAWGSLPRPTWPTWPAPICFLLLSFPFGRALANRGGQHETVGRRQRS